MTSKLLKQNPEYYSIWNHRRLVMQRLISEAQVQWRTQHSPEPETDDFLDPPLANLLKSDLAFLIPLLIHYPKCYWIWKHRLWLLENSTNSLFNWESHPLWDQELKLASKMLSRDSRNFNAWGYRRTVVAGIEAIPNMAGDLPKPLTESEFEYTTKMINANLSNFSAWHRRSKLIPRLLDERKASDAERRKMLDDELKLIERALYAGDNDQSLWFYHQHLLCTFEPRYAKDSMAPNLSTGERVQYVDLELEKVLDMLDGAEDCKWIYQALIHMSFLHWELTGTWSSFSLDLLLWAEELQKLDPLRLGRWKDLREKCLKYGGNSKDRTDNT